MPPKVLLTPDRYDSLHIRSRGYIPHWELDDAIYSITYRLADSLPHDVLMRLEQDRQTIIRLVTRGKHPTAIQNAEIRKMVGLRIDQDLDLGYGACHLRIAEAADAVIENLHHFDTKLYDLLVWCVMPNHVHVIVRLFRRNDLGRMIHSWKSYTSKRVNTIVGREGTLWEREYFDRTIRGAEDFVDTRAYVLNNPAKAGLHGWKWVGEKTVSL
jgi:putative transposase